MGWDWGHMGGWDHMGGWGMVWGWALFAVLLIGVVLLVVLLTRVLAGRGERPDTSPMRWGRARELLDESYARGEIDATEYDERRRRIDRDPET